MAPGAGGALRGRSPRLIDLVVFGRPAEGTDGGSARLHAYARFVEEQLGGRVVDLAAVASGRPAPVRVAAGAAALVRTLLRTRARFVQIEYPGFPALGVYYTGARPSAPERLVRALAYARAHAALRLIRALCRLRRRGLIVGVGDVPSQELHLPERGRLASERLTRRYERALLRAADAIWVVTPPERDLLARLYGIPPDRFVLVPNGNPRVPLPAPRAAGGPVRVVYAGSLFRDRESLEDAIRAALAVSGREVRVLLAGAGGEWAARAFDDPRVTWLGELAAEACFRLVAESDIGLLVYFRDEPYYELVHPTKLSLYVAAGVAIASGDAPYVARFVEQNGLGLAASREELPAALRRLIEDDALRRAAAERAAAIREDLFWDTIFERAVAATRAILARRPRPGAARGAPRRRRPPAARSRRRR